MFSALCLMTCLSAPQAKDRTKDPEWVEHRFYRVHLRNGNFIDGNMVKESPQSVTLRIKGGGDMEIRRDLISKVEFVKMRTVNELPPVVEPPKVDPARRPPQLDGVVAYVDTALLRARKATEDERIPILGEIVALGEEAALYLAGKLEGYEPATRALAVEVIAQVKSERTRPAIQQLASHKSPALRAQAAWIIGAAGWTGDGPLVRALLKDPEAGVRMSAVLALESVGDAQAVDPVADLVNDPARDVRARALSALVTLSQKHGRQDDLYPMLLLALSRSVAESRADLVGAVAGMGRAESWKVLVPYLNDAEAGVRATTVVGLTNLGVREGIVEIVKRMSQETDRAARAYMAAAAQRFKMREAIEPLIAWISPDEPELSQAAAVALQTITGQSLGSDREKWSQWWEKNRGK